jgi:FkbM family methyltransferase
MLKRTLLNIANGIISPFGVQLYKSGIDMEAVIKVMARGAQDVRTVIDIGASNGRWSKTAMKYFPEADFVAIDPLVEREPSLKQLKASHPKFDYVLCVAGEKANESIELSVSDDLDGSTVGGHEGRVRSVPSHSIDAIAEMKNCRGPFILKFDTHGVEVPILSGAAETLKQTSFIVMEVYNFRHTETTRLFPEMCALLDTLGFRCFNLADPMQRPSDNSLWQMDLFFARKENPLFQDNSYQRV